MISDDPRLGDLASEHDRIRDAGRELAQLIGDGDIAAAQRRFGPFAEVLRNHLAVEEAGVLAALEPVPELSAAVARLRDQHDELRADLARATAATDDEMWAKTVAALLHDFALHEVEEEDDVFRAAEVVLPYPTAVNRAQRFPLAPPDDPASRPRTFPVAATPLK